jgi:phosphoribosylanthranilate isomerase
MPSVKVKICGVTNWTDARQACEAGADFLGFNFWPQSSRYITPARARQIVRRLPRGIVAVGVFVDETESKTLKIARTVGLDYLQLHGDESPDVVARLQRILPVIKAIRVRESFRPIELARYGRATAILLDGFDREQPGGTGKTFMWNTARRALRYGKIFLAGGLTPENIADAIRVAKPFAVDVCSGVEARPGKKDAARVQAFLQAAKKKPAVKQGVKQKVRKRPKQ